MRRRADGGAAPARRRTATAEALPGSRTRTRDAATARGAALIPIIQRWRFIMKTTMILASLAAMTIAGNALALQADIPGVARDALVGGESAGQLVFVPLATVSRGPSPEFPYGACQYSATWNYPSAAVPA